MNTCETCGQRVELNDPKSVTRYYIPWCENEIIKLNDLASMNRDTIEHKQYCIDALNKLLDIKDKQLLKQDEKLAVAIEALEIYADANFTASKLMGKINDKKSNS